jgi:hypothetical protein
VSLSARGSRNLYDKEEKIEDPVVLAQVRKQASRVRIKSLLAAILLTLMALVLPVFI